jgi:hypothetical protein
MRLNAAERPESAPRKKKNTSASVILKILSFCTLAAHAFMRSRYLDTEQLMERLVSAVRGPVRVNKRRKDEMSEYQSRNVK